MSAIIDIGRLLRFTFSLLKLCIFKGVGGFKSEKMSASKGLSFDFMSCVRGDVGGNI